jgi:nicotinamidase-related amidase
MELTEGAHKFSGAWVEPATTALISMEMQRGVVGDLSRIPQLVGAVEAGGVIGHLAGLMGAARKAGVMVVHCNALFRADRKGSAANCPMLSRVMKDPNQILEGTPQTEVVPALGPDPADFVLSRYHGVSPFSGTSLDITLRNLGVKTIVATGVSVNLGIFGLCVEAVNLGYRVILPRDCVAGFPTDYADLVIKNSLAQLCTITTSDQVAEAWAAAS